ncbi:MAG: AAA family ATPase [Candidatus Ancaeobacter aquaticus]|nr:AAA family ATPase [Candidatus Ancaeobacter aquaticus]
MFEIGNSIWLMIVAGAVLFVVGLVLWGVVFHKKKMYIFFLNNWIKFVIVFAIVMLIILTVWGLSSMESFYRNMTIAQIPLQILLVAMNAAIFVYMYLTFFKGGFSQLKTTKVKSEDVKIKFSDVIGIDEAKEESMEVVNLIRDHARVKAIGGKIIRGLLMIGPPGCGKTLLAKAIATEAKIPFISIAGSEFVEVFVGVGASRVRKLFQQARKLAYAHGACIVFIDELDVIGRARQFSYMGGGSETNSTQNQLLVEMDGLGAKKENIIVIGATNSQESILDPALLRPGRFDRKIFIDSPYAEGRKKLFEYYLGKVKYDSKIDLRKLANYTVGKSAADIENIVKEAALIATREGRDVVQLRDLTESMERIDLGLKRKRKIPDRERRNTAYHEAGHAIAIYYLHPFDDVFKLSIMTRTETLGVCHHQPLEEIITRDRDWFMANIQSSLGGYVAEKLRFKVTSSGVSGDFRNAMQLAHTMVWNLGMASDGLFGDYTAVSHAQGGNIDYLSENVKERLNKETESIMQQCYKDVEDLLTKEKELLDALAEALLEKEEIDYDAIDEICKTHGKTEMRRIEECGVLQKFRESFLEDTNSDASAEIPAPVESDDSKEDAKKENKSETDTKKEIKGDDPSDKKKE